MKLSTASKILGLDGTEDLREIKSKYRKLMHKFHPDATGDEASNAERAAEINRAYQTIMTSYNENLVAEEEKRESRKSQKPNWSGKENPNAYADRPIYHEVEGFDGESIGVIEIARGKFVWSLEEEFKLFLKSVLDTSKDILGKIDVELNRESTDAIKNQYLADLTYLLTSQFIDSKATLTELTMIDDGTFKIDAMVELDETASIPKVGSLLYPAGVASHKLYLRNMSGQIVGYLSFKDDRLYYVIIPLFEQKRAQVKMVVAEKKLKTKTRKQYVDLDLWIKLDESTETTAVESIELQIRELLGRYRGIL